MCKGWAACGRVYRPYYSQEVCIGGVLCCAVVMGSTHGQREVFSPLKEARYNDVNSSVPACLPSRTSTVTQGAGSDFFLRSPVATWPPSTWSPQLEVNTRGGQPGPSGAGRSVAVPRGRSLRSPGQSPRLPQRTGTDKGRAGQGRAGRGWRGPVSGSVWAMSPLGVDTFSG